MHPLDDNEQPSFTGIGRFANAVSVRSTNLPMIVFGGPAGPLAQTVVAPDAATDGVLSDADANIFCSALLDADPDRAPHNA